MSGETTVRIALTVTVDTDDWAELYGLGEDEVPMDAVKNLTAIVEDAARNNLAVKTANANGRAVR